MNELLQDFLSDTSESLERVGEQLARLAQDPSDRRIQASLLRQIHTIKGTAGFLSLPRLEALAEAGETLLAARPERADNQRGIADLAPIVFANLKTSSHISKPSRRSRLAATRR